MFQHWTCWRKRTLPIWLSFVQVPRTLAFFCAVWGSWILDLGLAISVARTRRQKSPVTWNSRSNWYHHLLTLLTMNNPQQVNKAMSVLLAIGGMIGFAKSGSKMSLFSGLISAATYHKAANEMGSSSTSSSKRQAHKQSFYCSAILFVVMFMRYLKTGKIMPSGAVALIAGYTAKLGYDNMKNK